MFAGSQSMPLLEQRIPAIYIQLEQEINQLAAKRLAEKKNPVLNTQQYRLVMSILTVNSTSGSRVVGTNT